MKTKTIPALLLITIFVVAAFAESRKEIVLIKKSGVSGMQKTVETFYKIRERTLDERGTEKDVADLLGLMTDDVIYEHPVANVKMTKEQVKDGMTAHLKEGRSARYTLRNIRTGNNFVVVELTLEYEVDGKPVKRSGVSIFEFAKGKIQRVAEY